MTLKMVVPKGRMNRKVIDLLADIGLQLSGSDRSYRPSCSDPNLEIKLLKSANIPPLVALGQHDCGFAGNDWVKEQQADVVTVLDLGFDPVRLVACIPEDWDWAKVKARRVIAVSEYENLCKGFLEQEGLDYDFLRSYGATEVFPPEDADLIVDNTSTGQTLKENRLQIVATVMESTTRFIAHPRAMDDPVKRKLIEDMATLFGAVLEGRSRVLLEMNCRESDLEKIVAMLPAMKSPTLSKLYGQDMFALKAAVPRKEVRALIPNLQAAGAFDILETAINKVLH